MPSVVTFSNYIQTCNHNDFKQDGLRVTMKARLEGVQNIPRLVVSVDGTEGHLYNFNYDINSKWH